MSSPEVTKLVSDHDNESVEATTFKDQTWDIDINVSKCFQFSIEEPQKSALAIIVDGIWDPGLTMHVWKLRGLDDKPHKLSTKIFVAKAVEWVEVENTITSDKETT